MSTCWAASPVRLARARACVCACVCAMSGARAWADTPRDAPAAIEVDRDDSPPARGELGFDGGAPLPTWGLSLATSWLERPITIDATEPVHRRQTLALGGALALGTSTVIDARLGLSHQIGDRLRAFGDSSALDRYALGDLHLGARIRVVGDARRAAFVRSDLTLPTGDDGDFAGEASWSLAWRLVGRVTLPGDVVLAATAGIRLRGIEVLVGDRLVGDELAGAVGVAVPLPPICPLWCVRDQVKLTAELAGVLGDDVGGDSGPSPVEARLGLVTRPQPWLEFAARVGSGLADQIGSPRVRAMLELAYIAP